MPTEFPRNSIRCLIDRKRIDEMRGYGWRVVDADPAHDGEHAVVMEGTDQFTPRRWGVWP
jgi:hypothetical protein